MPKAPVNEDCFFSALEYQIRRARQFLRVEPISITKRVHEPSNDKFRLGVLSVNSGHQGSASSRIQLVHGALTGLRESVRAGSSCARGSTDPSFVRSGWKFPGEGRNQPCVTGRSLHRGIPKTFCQCPRMCCNECGRKRVADHQCDRLLSMRRIKSISPPKALQDGGLPQCYGAMLRGM